ncbi:MAG TPA: response regulator [Longimicrobiales bacterium]|nr:response regulator [Longimicrobiales bacterium]
MNQHTVLVVDDNEDNRIIFATCLQSRGYAVMLAKNGEEAVRMVGEFPPAAILMDIHMPVMNGIVATQTLKARGDLASIPVLAVSAYDVHEPELRQAGFCTFLSKPVAPAFLAHAVRVCIESASRGGAWIRVGPMEASP